MSSDEHLGVVVFIAQQFVEMHTGKLAIKISMRLAMLRSSC